MKVISLNIGEKRLVEWRGKDVETGIYKFPAQLDIVLGATDVVGDNVVDRKYHGGLDKACYLYSADHYAFWKKIYPDLEWDFGMFGENITAEGFNEKQIQIGDILRIGGATVQVSQPRQPCFKLGIRFNDQSIIKKFIQNPYPGAYLRILDTASISLDDPIELVERLHNSVGLLEVWEQLYTKDPDQELIQVMLDLPFLADECQDSLRKRLSAET